MSLSNVPPCFSLDDGPDCGMGNAVLTPEPGKISMLSFVCHADLAHLITSKFSQGYGFSLGVISASFRFAISLIVGIASLKKVSRITARRIVAMVKDVFRRHPAIGKKKREAMRLPHLALIVVRTISIGVMLSTYPIPASILLLFEQAPEVRWDSSIGDFACAKMLRAHTISMFTEMPDSAGGDLSIGNDPSDTMGCALLSVPVEKSMPELAVFSSDPKPAGIGLIHQRPKFIGCFESYWIRHVSTLTQRSVTIKWS